MAPDDRTTAHRLHPRDRMRVGSHCTAGLPDKIVLFSIHASSGGSGSALDVCGAASGVCALPRAEKRAE
eukprot:4008460-Prymnesium_polylepis.2